VLLTRILLVQCAHTTRLGGSRSCSVAVWPLTHSITKIFSIELPTQSTQYFIALLASNILASHTFSLPDNNCNNNNNQIGAIRCRFTPASKQKPFALELFRRRLGTTRDLTLKHTVRFASSIKGGGGSFVSKKGSPQQHNTKCPPTHTPRARPQTRPRTHTHTHTHKHTAQTHTHAQAHHATPNICGHELRVSYGVVLVLVLVCTWSAWAVVQCNKVSE
jgi:hypothetical protein